MYKCGLRTGVFVAGVLLASCGGCQTEELRPAPGALPTGLRVDASPRLNASTYFAHGHLLERQGSYDQAVEQYRRALELSPSFLSARNRLGITLNKLGRHAEATAEFRLLLEGHGAEAHLHNNLGFSLYLEGRYAEADKALRRALELKPDYTRARMNHGVVLARLGQYEAALGEFALATGEADAHYNLGVVQSEMGDFAAAACSLEAALRLNPRLEVARQQLHVVARLAAEVEAAAREDMTVVQETSAAVVQKASEAGAGTPAVELTTDSDAAQFVAPTDTAAAEAWAEAQAFRPDVGDAQPQPPDARQAERLRLMGEIIRRMVALKSQQPRWGRALTRSYAC